MARPSPLPVCNPEAPRVLSEAVRQIAAIWQLSNARLGQIIGLSPSTVSRLRCGTYRLKAGSKALELAQHLLCLFRSLDSWLGQDGEVMRSWLITPNLDLGCAPIELIASARGLLCTSNYVDDLCMPA